MRHMTRFEKMLLALALAYAVWEYTSPRHVVPGFAAPSYQGRIVPADNWNYLPSYCAAQRCLHQKYIHL